MISYTDGLFGYEGRQKSDNISAIPALDFIHERARITSLSFTTVTLLPGTMSAS